VVGRKDSRGAAGCTAASSSSGSVPVSTQKVHPTVQQANGKGESKYEAHNGSIADDEHMMGQ
jgi:hypothetical protein